MTLPYFNKVFYSSLDSHERMIPWLLSKIPQDILELKGKNKVEVAFDELLTNIYEHGYSKHPFPIFLKIVPASDHIQFEIRDFAQPFNLLNHEKKQQLEDPQIGGLGITFIKAVFEGLDYQYKNHCNIISFKLSRR